MGRIDAQHQAFSGAQRALQKTWSEACSRWNDSRRDELARRHVEVLDGQADATVVALDRLNEALTRALAELRKLD